MTIRECISRLDSAKPNTWTDLDKIAWLSKMDGDIYRKLILTHEWEKDENGQDIVIEFDGYDDTTDTDTELLVSAPFDELYLRFLEAQIDYANGEYGKYNNSISAYNSQYADFAKWFNRTHMPRGTVLRFF